MSHRKTCYFCGAVWGQCRCTGPVAAAFAFECYWVTDPSISVCGRFFVDPIACYGNAFVQARRQWQEYRCAHGCKANATCDECGAPMCDHSHEIWSTGCLQCDQPWRCGSLSL